MITVSADYHPEQVSRCAGARSIIAQPNQSADWETNKQLLLGLGLLSGVIATGFTLVGAWLILPFAGLEMTALGGALYVVCRKLNMRHVLYFAGDQLVIEKGMRFPQRVWRLPRQAASIIVERQNHPWDPIKINLCCRDQQGAVEQISIGEFLNKEDSQLLLDALRRQGLAVRSDSDAGAVPI